MVIPGRGRRDDRVGDRAAVAGLDRSASGPVWDRIAAETARIVDPDAHDAAPLPVVLVGYVLLRLNRSTTTNGIDSTVRSGSPAVNRHRCGHRPGRRRGRPHLSVELAGARPSSARGQGRSPHWPLAGADPGSVQIVDVDEVPIAQSAR
ncbi:hypothetical protein HBB16_06565 [Pseudonocardia sp. MCCB 268]|nr:hypothetical protein [Pseudonocardia cytotoxica]